MNADKRERGVVKKKYILKRVKRVLFGFVTEYLNNDGQWYMSQQGVKYFETKKQAKDEAKTFDPRWGNVVVIGPNGGEYAKVQCTSELQAT